MTLKDLAIDHDYYASGSNYYSNDAGALYNTWADFYDEFADADIDMNLVYRWDVFKREKGDGYHMQIVIIGQRKGIYIPIHISYVHEYDVNSILSFMKPDLGFNDDEDADVYFDSLRGRRVIRFAILAVVIFFSILIYILS